MKENLFNKFLDDLHKWQCQSQISSDDAWEYYRDYRKTLRNLREAAKYNWFTVDTQIQNIVMMYDDHQPEPTIPLLPYHFDHTVFTQTYTYKLNATTPAMI